MKTMKRPKSQKNSPSRGDVRKQEIIRATLDCLSKEGLFYTTYESIGSRIGIGKSHVLYHFPSLDDLVLSALGFAYATGQEIVVEFMSAEGKGPLLERYIDGTFHWIETHPSHGSAAALLFYQASLSPKFLHLQQELRAVGLERIKTILSTQFPRWKGPRLQEAAEMVQGLILGTMSYAGLKGTKEEFRRVREAVKEASRRICGS